jgi:hypothetical protein
MVEKMASEESKDFAKTELHCDFDLPVFTEPMKEHWPLNVSWAEAVRSMAPFRDYYMRHFYSAEQRLRDKNPEPFRMP